MCETGKLTDKEPEDGEAAGMGIVNKLSKKLQ